MVRRPHADLIEQWLADDSIVIEFRADSDCPWAIADIPSWGHNYEYRIKQARVYPVTSMSKDELLKIYTEKIGSHPSCLNEVANAVIKRYINDCEAKK